MDWETTQRILDIQEKAMADAEYKKLLEELAIYDEQMQQLYKILSKEQLAVLTDYLGVGISLHLRLLELACSDNV